MSNCIPVSNRRNYGIDLLRILSMLYVVVLHCLGHGGVLSTSNPSSVQFKLAWFMEVSAYGAVDIFALISGYVGFRENKQEYHYTNLLIMWFQVIFYGILVSLLYMIFSPDMVSFNDLIPALFPLKAGYWYFNAYVGLFFFIPFLNAGINSFSENALLKISTILFILFSLLETAFSCFDLNKGYSVAWLIVLYVMGATIKKCNICSKIKPSLAIIGILICILLTWLQKVYGVAHWIGINISKGIFVSYVSPTILIVAILHIVLFSRINFSTVLKRIISFAAPGSFAVYLLNNQRLIWANLMGNRFVYLSEKSPLTLFTHILFFSLLFVVCSILIDHIRMFVFKKLHINQFSFRIESVCSNCLNRLFKQFLDH